MGRVGESFGLWVPTLPSLPTADGQSASPRQRHRQRHRQRRCQRRRQRRCQRHRQRHRQRRRQRHRQRRRQRRLKTWKLAHVAQFPFINR